MLIDSSTIFSKMIGRSMLVRHLIHANNKYSCRPLSNDAAHKLESLKKEWKLSLGRTDDGTAYTIRLNNHNLKTPMRNLLVVPDETLALAIANEWRTKAGRKNLDLPNMHLTTLAYEAIDNPFNESKELVIDSILEYLRFDTVRFRTTDNEELLTRQSRHWDPLIGWFEHQYNCSLPIEYGDILSTGNVPKHTVETLTRHLHTHQRWPLVGVRSMTKNLKSFVLATCLAERFLGVEQAVELARLETRFQTDKWSKVEWEHDIDEHCTTASAAAGTLFYHLSI